MSTGSGSELPAPPGPGRGGHGAQCSLLGTLLTTSHVMLMVSQDLASQRGLGRYAPAHQHPHGGGQSPHLTPPPLPPAPASPNKQKGTHLETSEMASEQMAGQGTNLMRMCPRAAGKWARVTFSSTELKVWMSAALQEGSPEPVSRTFPPCNTSRRTCVLQERCEKTSWKGHWWGQREAAGGRGGGGVTQ